jgi:hypothetical protein
VISQKRLCPFWLVFRIRSFVFIGVFWLFEKRQNKSHHATDASG